MSLGAQLAEFQVIGGEVPEPTVLDFERHEIVAPGDEALLPAGIVYQAPWQDPADGMAVHARRQARALAISGLPVCLHGYGPTGGTFTDDDMEAEVIAEVDGLRGVSLSETLLAVRQLVIQGGRHLETVIVPAAGRLSGVEARKRIFASTIVYTSWERSTVHASIVEILNRCAQVWVPCERNRTAFGTSGVSWDRLRVVPCPYDPATLPAAQIPAPRGTDDVPEGRRFYSVGKWEPRKGHHQLVGAFLQAFTPADRVSLFIKTSGYSRWENYPGPTESLGIWARDVSSRWSAEQIRRRVRIVDAKLSEHDLNEVHRQNNIYVRTSHGEAWDLPAFDAVAAGNSLVHVPWGGTEDFAPPDAIPVPWHADPVHPGYGWEPEARWAEYALPDLVEALKRATPPRRRVHPPWLVARYGMQSVGQKMREHILDAVDTMNPGNAARLAAAGGFGDSYAPRCRAIFETDDGPRSCPRARFHRGAHG